LSLEHHPRHPPSFPTRRSSDLECRFRYGRLPERLPYPSRLGAKENWPYVLICIHRRRQPQRKCHRVRCESEIGRSVPDLRPTARSEEHTSELQSRENLVCRLLL